MAKKVRVMAASLFEEPPMDKAREPMWPANNADLIECGHPHQREYADGFDGGAEPPSNIWLDRQIYPHKESSMEKSMREDAYNRAKAVDAIKDEEFRRSRDFGTTESAARGEDPYEED